MRNMVFQFLRNLNSWNRSTPSTELCKGECEVCAVRAIQSQALPLNLKPILTHNSHDSALMTYAIKIRAQFFADDLSSYPTLHILSININGAGATSGCMVSMGLPKKFTSFG